VPVLTEDELRALLTACEGSAFEDRRDTAIVRLFIDSGIRRAEMASVRLDDVDLDAGAVLVHGKGNRYRHAPFGGRTPVGSPRCAFGRTNRASRRWPHYVVDPRAALEPNHLTGRSSPAGTGRVSVGESPWVAWRL
jgi:integrase